MKRQLARVARYANELATNSDDDTETDVGEHLLFLLTPSPVLDKAGL